MSVDLSNLRDAMDEADRVALRHLMDSALNAVDHAGDGTELMWLNREAAVPEVRVNPDVELGVRLRQVQLAPDGPLVDVAEFGRETADVLIHDFRRRGEPQSSPELAGAVDSVLGAATRYRLGPGDPIRNAFGAAFRTDPDVRREMLEQIGMDHLAEEPPAVPWPARTAAAQTIVTGIKTMGRDGRPSQEVAAELAQRGVDAPLRAGQMLLEADPLLREALFDPATQEEYLGGPLREAFQAVEEDDLGINARQEPGDQIQLGRLRGIQAITEVQKRLVDVRQKAAYENPGFAGTNPRMSQDEVATAKARIEAKAAWRSTHVLHGMARARAYGWAAAARGRYGIAWQREWRRKGMSLVHGSTGPSRRAVRRAAPISADFFRAGRPVAAAETPAHESSRGL